LYWNDFQIYKIWTWFSDSIREGGFAYTLSSLVDFRQNTGELIVASSKIYNPALDIAAWIYVLTENIDIAFFLKFYIYSGLCAFSYYLLLKSNLGYQKVSANISILIWTLLVASTIFHPVLHYETGPLNQWYFLLTPAWILILKEIVEKNVFIDAKCLLKILALTLLSIGSSDLFFIASITIIFLIFFMTNFKKSIFYRLLTAYGFLMSILIIDRSYYIKETIFKDLTISSQNSWGGRYYWDNFLYSLIQNPVKSSFVGPANLYVNILILGLVIYILLNPSSSRFRQKILSLIIVFVLFFGLGFFFHQIPVLSNFLPSAIRYHLNVFPFVLMSIIAAYGMLHNGIISRLLKFSLLLNTLGLISLIFILSYIRSVDTVGVDLTYSRSVDTVGVDLINKKVLFEYRNVVNFDVRNYYINTLPNCVNTKISNVDSSLFSKSYLFVKKKGTSASMDDTLLILFEQPNNLYGRTFNQWGYTTNKMNYNLHDAIKSSGLFSRPFLAENTDQLLKFSNLTQSPFLISTESKLANNFRLLGICIFPENLRSYVSANPTLGQDVYIFMNDEGVSGNKSDLKSVRYSSSYVKFNYECQTYGQNFLKMPINYLREMNVTTNGKTVIPSSISPGLYNSTNLNLNLNCEGQNILQIIVNTNSKVNLIKNIFLFCLPLVLVILAFTRRKKKTCQTGIQSG